MNRAAVVILGLLLAAAFAFGQQTPSGGTSATAAAASPGQQAAAPSETEELVLPPIVLEIEDLSVVRVDARLPPEEELLPPALAIPLPEAGELRVGEPSLPSASLAPGEGTAATTGAPLSSEIALGAGSSSHVSALVKLGTAGESPVQLSFAHESLDGFGGRPAGSGFGSRSDQLGGSLQLEPGGVDLRLSGAFGDDELGLQGQSPAFVSRSLRTLEGGAKISGNPWSWLSLGAGLDGGAIDHTLTTAAGSLPASTEELRVKPSLEAAATFGQVRVGLGADYGFHAGTFGPEHRFTTSATLGVDLSSAWSMDGSVGWYWASPGAAGQSLSVFPFSLRLTGVVADVLTFTVQGGRRATPIDLADLMAARPLLEPAGTTDSVAWFGETSLSVGFARGIAGNLGLSVARESAMLDLASPTLIPDPFTGLFAIDQHPADRLTLKAGARWSPVAWLTLNASGSLDLLDRPLWDPAFAVNVEGSVMTPSGAAGGRVSVGLQAGAAGIELPEIGLGGFLRASPTVRLRLDALDLLSPLLGFRTDLGPYVRPGFRVTAAAEITF